MIRVTLVLLLILLPIESYTQILDLQFYNYYAPNNQFSHNKFILESLDKKILKLIQHDKQAQNDRQVKSCQSESVHINSNDLTIDQVKQKVYFIGEVIIYFDNILLKTDNLEITYKIVANKKIIDYIIIPTKIIAKRKWPQELLIADSAKYYIDKKELTLLGNVILQYQDRIFKTNRLLYHTKLQSIQKNKE